MNEDIECCLMAIEEKTYQCISQSEQISFFDMHMRCRHPLSAIIIG